MKLAVIGSTGATGTAVVRLALSRNHTVTAVARSPATAVLPEDARVVAGDVRDPDSLRTALTDMDAVISCFGPTDHRKVGNLMSHGTRNIVQACERNGVRQLVWMSGFVQSDGREFSRPNRVVTRLLQWYFSDSYHDKVIAEAAVQESLLEWVIVRASGLARAPGTGTYRAGVRARISPFRALPYADCAACLLDAVAEGKWTNQVINVGKY